MSTLAIGYYAPTQLYRLIIQHFSFFLDLTSKVRDSRLSVLVITSTDMKQHMEKVFKLSWHSHIKLLGITNERLQSPESVIHVAVHEVNAPKSIIFYTDHRVLLPTKILEDIRKVKNQLGDRDLNKSALETNGIYALGARTLPTSRMECGW